MKIMLRLTAVALVATGAIAQTVRVGTFHKPSIVVAFYRSPMWSETMKAKIAEMEQARKVNDTKRAGELDTWGKTRQEIAHQQLTGEAPITNILEALAPSFPDIARQAQVSLVAADMPYSDPTVQTVDITDLLLDWLKADDRTRSMVRDIRSHPGPLPPIH